VAGGTSECRRALNGVQLRRPIGTGIPALNRRRRAAHPVEAAPLEISRLRGCRGVPTGTVLLSPGRIGL
jgi:hypothetical protein